jgi:hypothetical protein
MCLLIYCFSRSLCAGSRRGTTYTKLLIIIHWTGFKGGLCVADSRSTSVLAVVHYVIALATKGVAGNSKTFVQRIFILFFVK